MPSPDVVNMLHREA